MRSQAADQSNMTDSLPKSIGAMKANEDNDRSGFSGEHLSRPSYSSVGIISSSEVKSELAVQPIDTEASDPNTVAPEPEQTDKQDGSTSSEAGARLVQAVVHASMENGEKEPSGFSSSSEEKGAYSEKREGEEEEEEEEDGSRKDDYSEGDLVDISAYSGLGEDDSGGSQLDDEEDDEEDEEAYQPETSCSEIPGLPDEEEPPPSNRKIQFSTAPIKVSLCQMRLPFNVWSDLHMASMEP